MNVKINNVIFEIIQSTGFTIYRLVVLIAVFYFASLCFSQSAQAASFSFTTKPADFGGTNNGNSLNWGFYIHPGGGGTLRAGLNKSTYNPGEQIRLNTNVSVALDSVHTVFRASYSLQGSTQTTGDFQLSNGGQYGIPARWNDNSVNNFTAPTIAGSYNVGVIACSFQNFLYTFPDNLFSNREPDCKSGSLTFTVVNTNTINNAACVPLTGNPTTVTAGATFGAGARIRNTGNTTWTAASGYQLASVNPTWNTRWGSPTFGSVGNQVVLPNQEAGFLRVFTAPTTPGNYPFDWQMFVSYFPFGQVCRLNVNVVGGASCTPTKPAYSTYHTGDNVGLSVDTRANHNLSNTGAKCEYFCNTGFEDNDGRCLPVTVTPPPIVYLNPSPDTIEAGNSSTLTWSVGGQVTACEASLGWSGVKSTAGDSEDVSPLTTTNYRLSCVGPGGTTAKTATVNVTSSPVVGSCSALPGTNASFHPGDNSVSVNTTSLHSDTNTNAQCEFFCSPPSSWNSSTCVAPAPTPVPTDLTISVGGQSIIRSGGKVNVTWTAKSEDPLLNCVVTGGGISDNFKPSDAWSAVYTKSSQTTTLANATTFSLKCSDGTRNFEAFDRVEVIPSFQEI